MKKRQQIFIRTIILSMMLSVIVGLLVVAQTRSNPVQAAATTRLVLTPSSSEPEQQDGDAKEPGQRISTTDHSKFEDLRQPFETGPDVTKACLVCHTEAAKQVHQTIHWKWEVDYPDSDRKMGKQHVVNNFCISIQSNEPRCTSCHAGYGWEDNTFDFTSEENVDCLVCHDTTGTYRKFPTGAGHPVYGEAIEYPPGSGEIWEPPDLSYVALNVGKTSRETCGACHYYGGGDAGVKHGTLDPSLSAPDRSVDVHMDVNGPNFTCATCHTGPAHQVIGSRLRMTVVDKAGLASFFEDTHHSSCESCHGLSAHTKPHLNDHTDKVACQTCHVPALAVGGEPTKTTWDWSQAGRLAEDGQLLTEVDEHGNITYLSKKGSFTWDYDIPPEYVWFNGKIKYTLPTDKIDDTKIVKVNAMQGSYDDPEALIYPVKVFRANQPYDTRNKTLVVPHVYGKDDTAYWGNYDWGKAIQAGMDYAGLPYSGQYGFVETEMYWPATHMVAPGEQALTCDACHSRDGRLAELSGFYMPGRDHNPLLDTLGWLAIAGSLLVVIGHGTLRFVLNRKGANEK